MHQYLGPFDNRGTPSIPESAIAIVGMSCRFANVRGPDEYWSLLREGREAIDTYSDEELLAAGVPASLLRDPRYVRRGAPLQDMECFDAALFGLSPRDAAIMDPQHRHFLECAWEALENAGYPPPGGIGTTGVFAGSGHNAYMPYNLLTNARLVDDVGLFLLRHTSNDKDFLTTRVSYLLDLKGPSINVQTACSTSLVSIHLAAQSLLSGECDMALAGGASIELPHRHGYLFEEGEILSPDGHCRPFDAASQGTVFGSGVAVLVLRRLEDAIDSGDFIHAVLRGSAINNDGASKVGYLAPSVDGQAKAIAEALAVADIDAGTIDYVEAHGTGTPVGDPIEVAALTQAFRQTTDQVGHCAIGSVKANIGHTDTAAGAAGVIKVALAMRHKELPASLNFTAPNPSCSFDETPFRVQAERAPWPGRSDRPRRAGVSSLGVGGTNAHVVIEEAPPRPRGDEPGGCQIVLASGRTETAANANVAALSRHFADHPSLCLADAAYTLATGRVHLPHRRFAVVPNGGDAAAALAEAERRDCAKTPAVPGRSVAFMFCGAGPQHLDMGRDLYMAEPRFRAHVDAALAALGRVGGPDLRRWLFPCADDRAPAARALGRPSIALPALFVIQTALARLWMDMGVRPAAMIGHSSGEYAAAHLAGVIDLESGLRIVSARGRLFEKTGDGGMLSVPMAEDELAPLLPPGISIAAINAPRLCVVSGSADAVAGFHDELSRREVEAQRVAINVAAHSPMLDPILDEFRTLMRSVPLAPPQVPFVSNLTGDWVTAAQATDPEYWTRHLRETVRFTDGLQRLLDDPERLLLEVGPGRSMGSLARLHPARRPSQPVVSSMRHPDQSVPDDVAFLEAAGTAWSYGAPVDWPAWWAGEHRLRVPLPTYQFDRQRHWIEPGAALAQIAGRADPAARQDIGDWQYEPVWARDDLPPKSQPAATGPVLVLEDDAGLAARLAERLLAEERDVVTVCPARRFARTGNRFAVDPANRAHWAALFDALAAEDRLPAQVYHCWLVTGPGRAPLADAQLLDLGLHALVALAPELARCCEGWEVGMALVTDRAQRVGSGGEIVPAKATAIGAARAVSSEYPGLRVRSIDVDDTSWSHARGVDALGHAIAAELAHAGDDRDVAWRAGRRWVLDYTQVAANSGEETALGTAMLRAGGTYLVTGGLGGLGLAVARHLANLPGTTIVLVSRTGLPPRADWTDLLAAGRLSPDVAGKVRQVLAIEAAGAQVHIVAADVADAAALRRGVRKALGRSARITGVFHAAGTLDDGLIETKERASIDRVLRPKVAGTLALEQALKGTPPEFMLLFSSISAMAGIPGQVDYAAANAFLDSYARRREGDPHTRVLSVGWSRWAEIGMAATLAQSGADETDLPAHGEGGAWRPLEHPFLERLCVVSADRIVATGTLAPEQHWVLDEHRLADGCPLMPGTGYLELIRAVLAEVESGRPVITDVTFLQPFAVPDGTARELRVDLRRQPAGDWRIAVMGRALDTRTDGWVEHVTATASVGAKPHGAGTLDLDAIAARCRPGSGGSEDQPALRFGPRWRNVRRSRMGEGEALLELKLAPAFDGDLARIGLHPALLDFATAGAQALIPGRDPARDFFAPFSYRSLVLHAPLPSRIVSHIRLDAADASSGQTATFDVTIADEGGVVLAEIAGFTMIRMRNAGGLSGRAGEGAGLDMEPSDSAPVDGGIRTREGLRVIEQVLRTTAAHVVVSPFDLHSTLQSLRAPPAAPRNSACADPADAPVTEAEKTIAGLWCDLLGLEAVGRNDNFFDLGGHSLLAVQFTNRLRKKTGHALPLSAMLDRPTVANLARIVDPDGAAAASEGAPDVEHGTAGPASPGLVTVRPGGSLAPIFFVHDGLGETLLYRGLALRLDPQRPVLGIEPLRLPGGGFAHTRIDEMAAEYVARIRAVRPAGPYLLAGLCAGGVIAFEMARQFEDMGERVAFVGIIDAADVEAAKRPFYITRSRLARLRASLAHTGAAAMLPALAGKALNAIRWEIGSRIRQARDRRTVRQMRQSGPASAPSADEQIPFLKLYEVAHREHRPAGLFAGGTVALFKGSHDTGEIDDLAYRFVYSDTALGWGKRVASDVLVVDVPGGHGSVLQEPYVAELAPLFQAALENAVASVPAHEWSAAESPSYPLFATAAE